MKKIKNFRILFTILLLLSFISCDRQEKKITRQYILENATDRVLKIDLYQFKSLRGSKITNGKGVVYQGVTDNDVGKLLTPRRAFNADSIIVSFDDNKRIIYYKSSIGKFTPSNRNIFENSSYQIESNELYRFTFTEEDYLNADSIK